MSTLTLINQSSARMPRMYIHGLHKALNEGLKKQKVRNTKLLKLPLVIVFVDAAQMKKINHEFRKKKYATDVLSFPGNDGESFGELIICPQVIARQAKEHGLSFKQELCYMIIHGELHLLGYDHEDIMFKIQDKLFEELA